MFDWRSISSDPSSAAVKHGLRDHLRSLDRGSARDRNVLIDAFVTGKTVLDVGVVQHTLDYTVSPNWLHGRIKRLARDCLGVDVLKDEIGELEKRGFRVRCADAASEVDLGERFERVVLGEIIEHVDNPVALLRFARRHLGAGGQVFVTTPNCFYYSHMMESLRHNAVAPNPEHVSFIPPSAALELGRRAGLELYEIRRVSVDPAQASRAGALGSRVMKALRPDPEVLSHTYCFYYR